MAKINRPKALSAKEWRAKKSLFTKMVSDASGMGKALDKLEEKWKNVPWDEVDPDQATSHLSVNGFNSTYTAAKVNELQKQARGHASKVDALKTQLETVESLASRTDTKWRANKLMPSASIAYLNQVKTAAGNVIKQINKLDEAWDDRKQGAAISEQLIREEWRTLLKARVTLVENAARAVLAKPTAVTLSNQYHAFKDLIALFAARPEEEYKATKRRLEQAAVLKNANRKITDKVLQDPQVAETARELLEIVSNL